MRNSNSLMIYVVLLAGLVFCGCESEDAGTELAQVKREAVYYPGAPDKPRLQFLRSISSSVDLGVEKKKKRGFESFIVGEEDEAEVQLIRKPYGVAIYRGKLYVCDVEKKLVEELDIEGKTFEYMTKERRMMNPVNITIDENGRKYISDTHAESVFVYDKNNSLVNVLGKGMGLKPVDVSVAGKRCYITDMNSKHIVVLDRVSGKEVIRFGGEGDQDGKFALIADIALDKDENVYVTDKGMGKINIFDRNGIFLKRIGEPGDSIHSFVRPKGIDVDREGNIWVIDAGMQYGKVYSGEGQLLMVFGYPGREPGNMYLPASIAVDYDNVELFREYFAEGAEIEFLVLVSNQYGAKVNVYGFGEFPIEETRRENAKSTLADEPKKEESVGGGA